MEISNLQEVSSEEGNMPKVIKSSNFGGERGASDTSADASFQTLSIKECTRVAASTNSKSNYESVLFIRLELPGGCIYLNGPGLNRLFL